MGTLMKETIENKIVELKKQQQMAQQLLLKCQGAIDILESLLNDKEEDVKKKK